MRLGWLTRSKRVAAVIDSATIERIRAASDIAAVIGQTLDLRPSGKELRGLCPFHRDHNPSLCVNSEKQRWYCHPCGKNGDVFRWIMLRDGIEFPDAVQLLARQANVPLKPDQRTVLHHAGVTVAQLVRTKRLDIDLVRALGITDMPYKGASAVAFPYYVTGEDTAPIAVKIRRTLEKRSDLKRFEWRKGDKPIPYGAWLLSTSGARQRGFVVVVEGESDFISLLSLNVPSLGVPGNSWREEWSHYLEGIARVLVSVEPDPGGERLVESLRKSSLWPRCAMIPFGTLAPVAKRAAS